MSNNRTDKTDTTDWVNQSHPSYPSYLLFLPGVGIRQNAHSRGKHERHGKSGILEGGFNQEGRVAVLDFRQRAVDAVFAFQGRAGPGLADFFQAEVPGLRVVGLPQQHLLRCRRAGHLQRAVGFDLPGVLGAGRGGQKRIVEGGGVHIGLNAQAVVGIGHVAQVLLAHEVVEVELPRVGREELIARRIDDVLRHGQAIAIAVGLHNIQQRLHFRGADPAHDFHLHILADGGRVEAIGIEVVFHRRHKIEHVDHSNATIHVDTFDYITATFSATSNKALDISKKIMPTVALYEALNELGYLTQEPSLDVKP